MFTLPEEASMLDTDIQTTHISTHDIYMTDLAVIQIYISKHDIYMADLAKTQIYSITAMLLVRYLTPTS